MRGEGSIRGDRLAIRFRDLCTTRRWREDTGFYRFGTDQQKDLSGSFGFVARDERDNGDLHACRLWSKHPRVQSELFAKIFVVIRTKAVQGWRARDAASSCTGRSGYKD